MSTKTEVVNGEIKITKTPPPTIETLSRPEVVGKRAESQTKVDHLQIDLDAAQTEVDQWDAYLAEIDK